MRTSRQRWLVSSIIFFHPQSFFFSSSFLFFFSLGRSSAFQQCRRRCAVISATRMPTTCLAFALRSSHLRLFPDWGSMADLREGKVWGHLSSVFPLTCPPCMRLPPRPSSLLQTDNGGHYHHREKQLTSNLRQRPDYCSGVCFFFFSFLFSFFASGIRQRCRRNFMCATLKDTAQMMVALLTAGVRSVTWVFPLYFRFYFLRIRYCRLWWGEKTHLNGRIPGGLRRDESREKCG